VFTYSKLASYENGVKCNAEFEELELFFEFVSQLKEVKMLAPHSYAALLYFDQGYQSSDTVDAVVSWWHQYAGQEGFSLALID